MQKYVFPNLILAMASTMVSFTHKGTGNQAPLGGIFEASTITGASDVTCRERRPGDAQANCSWTATVNESQGSSTSNLAIYSHSVSFSQEGPPFATYSASLTTVLGRE